MRRALPCCAIDPETRFDFVGGKKLLSPWVCAALAYHSAD